MTLRDFTGIGAAATLSLLGINGTATAQEQPDSACPPGTFCETTEVEAPPPPTDATETSPDESSDPLFDERVADEPLFDERVDGERSGGQPNPAAAPPPGRTVVIPPPPPGTDPNAPRVVVVHPADGTRPEQIVIYEPGAAPPHFPGYEPEPLPPPPKRKFRYKKRRRWGLNMRIDGVLMPQDEDNDRGAGMAGLGAALKYRPVPQFALGVGADFLGGTDSNGLERQEVPLTVSAYAYPNPRSLAQFYVVGGMNWAFARVHADEPQPNLMKNDRDDYTYFGGHLGVGVEFRVSRLIGINVDGLAFVRTRTDADTIGDQTYPEFYNPRTKEGSNTSTAGLLRGGVTFWW